MKCTVLIQWAQYATRHAVLVLYRAWFHYYLHANMLKTAQNAFRNFPLLCYMVSLDPSLLGHGLCFQDTLISECSITTKVYTKNWSKELLHVNECSIRNYFQEIKLYTLKYPPGMLVYHSNLLCFLLYWHDL